MHVSIMARMVGVPLAMDSGFEYKRMRGGDSSSRCSVVLDSGRAYALGTTGRLHCLDAKSGSVTWAKDLDRAFKIRMDWKGWRQDSDPEKDYQMFKLVREFLPQDVYLGFDANNGYSVSTAIQQGRRFEELGRSVRSGSIRL